MSSTSEVLRAARALVEKGWTRGGYSHDAKGEQCSYTDPQAVEFCAFYAIVRALTTEGWADGCWDALKAAAGSDSIIIWNDAPGLTQAEVLAAFSAAIEAAEQEQSDE